MELAYLFCWDWLVIDDLRGGIFFFTTGIFFLLVLASPFCLDWSVTEYLTGDIFFTKGIFLVVVASPFSCWD